MAFVRQGVLLVVFTLLLKHYEGVPLHRSLRKQRVFNPVKIVPNVANPGTSARQGQIKKRSYSFVFINDTEIAKGLDYLKKKYPDVDWSPVTPLPTVNPGKRGLNDANSLEQSKRTSSFVFINDTEIAKGLDYLKKKYPDVDWSPVTPLPTVNPGKRQLDSTKNSLEKPKRTSSFVFINDTEIAKGLDYLKKKYPDVDWSPVTPLPTVNPGKRQFDEELKEFGMTETKKDLVKKLDQLKRDMKNRHSSIAGRNDIPEYNNKVMKHEQGRQGSLSEPEEEINI